MPNLEIEKSFYPLSIIAGVDEAGRGPLAGPVVAAAVIIDVNNISSLINDSKKIPKHKHEQVYYNIISRVKYGVGIVDVDIIDSINILQATKLAMSKAVSALPIRPELVLVDGNQTFDAGSGVGVVPIVKGDTKSLSIAAASIIAKVTRDRIMTALDKEYPQYGWANNAAYGTKEHLQAIAANGITKHHRRSFKPIREAVEK